MFLCYKQLISNRHNRDRTFWQHQMQSRYWPRKETLKGFQFPSEELSLPRWFVKWQYQKAAQTLRLHLLSQNIRPLSFIHQEDNAGGASDWQAQQGFQGDIMLCWPFSTSVMNLIYWKWSLRKSNITTLLQSYLGSPPLRELTDFISPAILQNKLKHT